MMLLGDHPESITLKENVERQCSCTIIPYASKNAQVATHLLTSFKRLIMNKLISECVRMACDNLLTTSLFQVVNILVACDCQNLLSTALLQVDSTSCNKYAK